MISLKKKKSRADKLNEKLEQYERRLKTLSQG